jgi:hypothetical protein
MTQENVKLFSSRDFAEGSADGMRRVLGEEWEIGVSPVIDGNAIAFVCRAQWSRGHLRINVTWPDRRGVVVSQGFSVGSGLGISSHFAPLVCVSHERLDMALRMFHEKIAIQAREAMSNCRSWRDAIPLGWRSTSTLPGD